MRKTKAFIMLIILCVSLVTVAVAENNTTANATTTGTITQTSVPVATQAVTQPVQTVIQPTQTTQPVQTEVKEKKFRVGPTVRIRPLNDEINKNQDGLVEIYFDNPGLNDVSLTVDARISVPSGIHVYGQGFGEAAAAGMVYGKFEVPPGSARTINIVIKAEKIGDFSAQFTGTYYPDDNKDAYQPISLTHPFKVTAASADPLSGGDTEQKGKEENKPAEKSPGMTAILAIFAIAILAYRMRKN